MRAPPAYGNRASGTARQQVPASGAEPTISVALSTSALSWLGIEHSSSSGMQKHVKFALSSG